MGNGSGNASIKSDPSLLFLLELIEKPFEGEDEYGDDMGNKVMSIANRDNCIGCEACSRACTKKCHVHIEL